MAENAVAPKPTGKSALIPYIAKSQNEYLNLLVYGRPGVGKTTFAATAQDHPDMSPVLFLNVEGGMISVAGRGDINTIDVRSADTLEQVFWGIMNKDDTFSKFKTVVLDSGTELQNMGLEAIVRSAINAPKSSRDDIDRIYLEDYGKSTAQLTRLIRWFRDAEVHFILTAIPKFVYPKGSNENTTPEEVIPSFTAKLAESIQGFMDFVWYYYVDGEGDRWILTEERPPYRAKTRGPKFAEFLEGRVKNPHLPTLYNKFLELEGSE